jgi:hypothetical protein
MRQRSVSRFKAAHQPSSSRDMTCRPQPSVAMYRCGTPVAVSSWTSRRQQQAAQVAQVTSVV